MATLKLHERAEQCVKCIGCNLEKPCAEFTPDARRPNGVRSRCRLCQSEKNRMYAARPNAKATRHHWNTANREKQTAYRRAHNKRYPDRKKHQTYAWRKQYPWKESAKQAVARAIASGKLIRKPCEVCGKKALAHHDDYTKKLDVRWLCQLHHKEVHRHVA